MHLAADQGPDHVPGDAKAGNHHTQRDQSKGAEPLQGEQKAKQPAAEVAGQRARQWQTQQQARPRQTNSAGIGWFHAGSVGPAPLRVKGDFGLGLGYGIRRW